MKKKVKEVVKTQTEDGKDLKLEVRYPTSRNYNDAQVLYSAEWTRLVETENVKTQKQINDMLEEKGVWTAKDKLKEEVLAKEIVELRKRLKSGKTVEDRQMKKSEGRALAIEIHNKSLEFDAHVASRNVYIVHSAEGMAENKRFDYLVSVCVLDGNTGDPYFGDLEGYEKRKEEKAANDSARKLASMIYGMDFSENMEDNVMEIQFLKKFGFIDAEGNYVDPKTKQRVDAEGKPLETKEDVDIYGNVIKDGKVKVEFGEFLDDEETEASPQTEVITQQRHDVVFSANEKPKEDKNTVGKADATV